MRTGECQSLDRTIKFLITEAETMTDLELQSEIAKYICILSSGFIEASCRSIVRKYATPRCDLTTLSFITGRVGQYRNPNMENILQLIGSFDGSRRKDIEDNLNERLKEAVNSIIANRNLIAHGRNCGISLGVVKDYYERTCELMNGIESRFCS